MLKWCIIVINQHYLCSMLDFGIDGEEMSDKFLLTHGRYDEWNGAFQNLPVGKGDCQTVGQRSCRWWEYTFSRLNSLNLVDGISGRDKERIYHKFITVNAVVDAEECHKDKRQHHKTDNCRPDSVIQETRNNAAHSNSPKMNHVDPSHIELYLVPPKFSIMISCYYNYNVTWYCKTRR